MENIRQFKNLILEPILKFADMHLRAPTNVFVKQNYKVRADLYSPAAADLLLGTALVESNLSFYKQIGGGPALGFFQMEPLTFDDIYYRYVEMHPDLIDVLDQFKFAGDLIDVKDQLLMSLPFAIILARIKYLMIPAPIPESAEGQAHYWKKHYNTIEGKGRVEDYLKKWWAWKEYEKQQGA